MFSVFRREVNENWVTVQRVVLITYWLSEQSAIPYRHFGNDCPETLVRNYHYCLRNNPEERKPQITHIIPL